MKKSKIQISGKTYFVDVVSEQKEMEEGLSRRLKLQADEGMLFIFPDSDIRVFHTERMNFPIDIVWISDSGHVIGTIENAQPQQPDQSSKDAPRFISPFPCKYVLELLGGTVKDGPIHFGVEVKGLLGEMDSIPSNKLSSWISKQEDNENEEEIDLTDWSEGNPRLRGVKEEDILHVPGNIDYDPENAFWLGQIRKKKND